MAWDAAEAGGLVLQEAFMWRHTPQAARLLELLPRLGELVAVRATFSFQLEEDSDIRVNAELDGGALMDVGCYCVSGSRYVAGEEPELVFGQQADHRGRRRPPLHGPAALPVRADRDLPHELRRVTARASRSSAAAARSSCPIHGIRRAGCSSSTGWRSASSRRTRTAASSTTWPRRSAASARHGWAAPMRSARRARSLRSIDRLPRGCRSGCRRRRTAARPEATARPGPPAPRSGCRRPWSGPLPRAGRGGSTRPPRGQPAPPGS